MVMSNIDLEKQFSDIDGVYHVEVDGDGYHYQLIVVSDLFVNKSKIERQKWVYSILNKHIISGDLHAIQMQTWTRDEWEKKHG